MVSAPSTRRWTLLGMVAALIAGSVTVRANQPSTLKPIAVLCVTSVDEMVQDAAYLAQAASLPQLAGVTALMGPLTQGLDTGRPMGVLILADGDEPRGLIFIPVLRYDELLKRVEQRLGRADEVGGGIKKFTLRETVYFKPQGEWVFLSDGPQHLERLPENPTSLLDGLHQRYDLAVQFSAGNLTPELRRFMHTQVDALLARFESRDVPNPDRPWAQMQRNNVEAIRDLVQGLDQATLGWAVDRDRKRTILELSLTATPNTRLAEQMALLNGNKSDFSGFLLPDAAATFQFSGMLPEDKRRQLTAGVDHLREKIAQQIEKDPDLPTPEAKRTVRDIVGKALDVLEQTARDGKLDLGGAVLLDASSVRFAAGGRVADGKALEQAFKQIIELARNDPEVPDVQFDVDSHGQISFHTFEVPVREDDVEARQFLGEQLPITMAVGPDSFYVAMGAGGIELLKRVIDKSADESQQEVPPARVSLALAPTLNFLASVNPEDDHLVALAQATRQSAGNDHVLVTVTPIDRGILYRLEFEEGVIQTIAQAIKLNQ